MEKNVLHFDSDLGGNQTLPSSYSISNFLKERLEEVMMLTEHIKESPFRGQTFQRLPKHMRRKQMSHHIKRLPRRLQRPYLLTLREGLSNPTKCPSRKYRRRPGNLLAEYNRRQRSNVWLETHIWHSKRFHMIKKWGYSLPEAPTNKSFRACYRAASKHCLLSDISYYNCIELQGPEAKLLKGLARCTSTECGLTFGAKLYLPGTKEGSVSFYHPDSYPYNIIGNVTFIWKTPSADDTERTIWIWVHPLTHDEMVECLKNLFDLKEIEITTNVENNVINTDNFETENQSESTIKTNVKKKFKNQIEQIKLKPKNIPFIRMPKFVNDVEMITMTLLKDTLNRFRLTGPLSQAVISQTFSISKMNPANKMFVSPIDDDKETIVEVIGRKRKLLNSCETKESKITKLLEHEEKFNDSVEVNYDWWTEYYNKESSCQNLKEQRDFYENLKKCLNPTDVPPGIILALVINDPRLLMPNKKEKAVSKVNEPLQIKEDLHKTCLAESPIWSPNVRDKVSLAKLSTKEINEARSKNIVPSDVNDVIYLESRSKIPILLVQRPGVRSHQNKRLGFGSGWDIISPAGYGMPIWQALILRGARAGGLRESELLNLESNNLKNHLQPDSCAGKSDSKAKYDELRRRYFSLPPNKRPNFIKLGVPEPFYCAWDLLVTDWMSISQATESTLNEVKIQNYKVLRCEEHLQDLNKLINDYLKKNDFNLKETLETLGRDTLVPVLVECLGKGNLKDMSLICLPTTQDLENQSHLCPVEELHEDENKSARKALKLMHLKLLKSLKKKRKKNKEQLLECFANNSQNNLTWNEILRSNSSHSDETKKEYKEKMESLWIPKCDKIGSFVHFSSRKIMGFVVKGDFTFSKSISTGLGYVSLVALFEWLNNLTSLPRRILSILIRNRDQRQYRFARLTVLEE